MNIMDISFTRKFELKEKHIDKILKDYGNLTINSNFSMNLTNIKKSLSFIPIKSRSNVFKFSHPLGSIVQKRGVFTAYIGNKKIVKLKPQYFKMATTDTEKFDVIVDGESLSVNNASDIIVNDDFNIVERNGYRVNIIGYSSKRYKKESGVSVELANLNKRYSIDKANKVYRVEFYKNNEFCFMSKIHFQ
jgi:hypothetical protein